MRKPLSLLPDGVFLQQPLHRHGQLPQEAFDDGPTLGELVLDFDLQDVGGQRHEAEPLERRTKVTGSENCRGRDSQVKHSCDCGGGGQRLRPQLQAHRPPLTFKLKGKFGKLSAACARRAGRLSFSKRVRDAIFQFQSRGGEIEWGGGGVKK